MARAGPVPADRPPSQGRGSPAGDSIFQGLAVAAALLVMGTLAALLIVLFENSSQSFGAFGLQFLWSTTWTPAGNPLHPEAYSAGPFIFGTLVTSALAIVLGVPVSIGVAVFLTELSPPWLSEPLSGLVELLAAVPSVIYGLWGFFVLVPIMRTDVEPGLQQLLGPNFPLFSGTPLGLDKLTAGVILAVMIIPTVTAVSREAFRAVPTSQREAALSLGATRWETTRIGVISPARSGIFGAMTLGLGRAIGETMAVTMTIGNTNVISGSLVAPGQTIASLIATNFGESAPGTLFQSTLLELGLVLLMISLTVNVVARLLLSRVLNVEAGRE
jgi:phosphate transport system permease protein